MKRTGKPLCGLGALLVSCALLAFPARGAGPVTDYQVKAAYLYNFLKFIEWPETHDLPGEPVTICVLGGDPFFGELNDLADRQAGGRAIRVKYLNRIGGSGVCHMLFISAAMEDELPLLLQRLSGSPVLTVGDMNAFARRGGMIGFVVRDNRIRLEINLLTLKKAGVKASADLLEIATIVAEEGGER